VSVRHDGRVLIRQPVEDCHLSFSRHSLSQ
jgi:hypothetical protein